MQGGGGEGKDAKQAHAGDRDRMGKTPLHLAAEAGMTRMCMLLMDSIGARSDVVDASGRTPLMAACMTPCPSAETIGALLACGARPDVVDPVSGRSALWMCAHQGSRDVCRLLVDSRLGGGVREDVLLSTVDHKEGMTPLSAAARSGHSQVCEMLLEMENRSGAPSSSSSAQVVDLAGRTALHHAVSSACGRRPCIDESILRILVDRGCRVNSVDCRGRTALHTAVVESRCAETCEILLRMAADVRIADEDGNTPLHLAADLGDAMMCEAIVRASFSSSFSSPPTHPCHSLVGAGAAILARNKKGETPSGIAYKKANTAVLQFFVSLDGPSARVLAEDFEATIAEAKYRKQMRKKSKKTRPPSPITWVMVERESLFDML